MSYEKNEVVRDMKQIFLQYMIVVDTINLGSSENSLINNIYVQNSSIAFINFNSIIGTTTSPIAFIMQDIFYSN